MSCGGEWVALMHNVIDNEISDSDYIKLKEHLKHCEQCKAHYEELVQVNNELEGSRLFKAPDNFNIKVMERLPIKDKKNLRRKNWFKRYPVLTAASIFFLLMASTLFTQWNLQGENVSYEAQGVDLIVNEETDTVIVPEEQTVTGDLVVRNGNVRVDGKVTGDVIIIKGEYMASAGNVVGESKEIKKITEWILFTLKDLVNNITR